MKKLSIFILILVICFICLLPANATELPKITVYFNGNQYLELEKTVQTHYLMGLYDMLMNLFYDYFPDTAYLDFQNATEDLAGNQLREIFNKYLEENTEKWHFSAASLFYNVLWDLVYPSSGSEQPSSNIDSLLKELKKDK